MKIKKILSQYRRHIEARVEEETKRIIQQAIMADRVLSVECKDRMFDMIETSPRKYAKQEKKE